VVEDYRKQSRTRWGSSAGGWEQRADWLRRTTMPVSAWMVDAIVPQPGHTILDLAAGLGDTGFLAAELIQPGGTLICSDFAPEMLSAAQRRAEALGIRNVRFRQIDAEGIDQPAASLDGVLCRWAYMLMADPEAAVRETRRVLRPGARVALAVWTGAEDNPWAALPSDQLVARGLLEDDDPTQPGRWAWAPEGVIAEQLEAVGFVEHEVVALDFTMRYPSVEAWWETTAAMSARFAGAAATLDAAATAELEAALREQAAAWTADDGSLAMPARTWVAAATA
jgi:SAM-dependent methyltransferase